jgi:hypothetical protein
MLRRRFRHQILALVTALAGYSLAASLPSCQDVAYYTNPCAGAGNVFTDTVCARADWFDFFDGFQPNYDRDPFCTQPQTCPEADTYDPFAGDGRPGIPTEGDVGVQPLQ